MIAALYIVAGIAWIVSAGFWLAGGVNWWRRGDWESVVFSAVACAVSSAAAGVMLVVAMRVPTP